MSVALLSKEEIIKTCNTLSQQPLVQDYVRLTDEFKNYKAQSFGIVEVENFIARAVWYGYVANVTAYNVQYQEKEQLDFNLEGEEDYGTLQESIDTLGSLIYNCFTNDGNSFLQDKWMNVLQAIKEHFYEEEAQEMPSWTY